ncbi:hypothetical protein Ccrd_026497 [Cynara cardunculus var. scolymus]|uniref:Glycosyltransferase family 92 protein n=1 Tax=Cynara cardunculus var. scolymus TaxID=59895 RepID=A0A118H403_CYNCS|nr:hypothetical protein Ccrd_026497 [Cynara cardunculus var. scolymus]
MAGLYPSIKPSPSSSSLSQSSQVFASRILLLLTLLPLSLAAFAFVLQWRGEISDPITRWSSINGLEFPGMDITTTSKVTTPTSSNCADILGQSRSISFPYFRDWKFNLESDLNPKICITSSTSAGLEQILPWIFYHKVIGVTNFFLFVEGKAATPGVSKVLESIPVSLIWLSESGMRLGCQASSTNHATMSYSSSNLLIWKWLLSWQEYVVLSSVLKLFQWSMHKHDSMKFLILSIYFKEAHMEWIIHLDTDELIHPAGTREYSLRQLLSDLPENVDMVVFPNYESCVERDNIQEPFSEVSMFKKNYDHLMKETYFGNYKDATRGNPNYFLTYGNGKAGARIQPHLRPNGAHRWHNYMKNPNEYKLEEAAVLHYTYTKFSDLTSRRDRCGCKPTKEEVKRCFMLEFDRDVSIDASPLCFYNCINCNGGGDAKLVIMQGLREAGVYSSLIESVQTSSWRDPFSSSDEIISNSSKAIDAAGGVSSRKIGNKEPRIGIRSVLQAADIDLSAMPPLSPPVMDDIHRYT